MRSTYIAIILALALIAPIFLPAQTPIADAAPAIMRQLNTPSFVGWTLINNATCTIATAGSPDRIILKEGNTYSGGLGCVYWRAAPGATPWTLTFGYIPIYQVIGKTEHVILVGDSTTNRWQALNRYQTTIATGGSNYTVINYNATPAFVSNQSAVFSPRWPIISSTQYGWFRVVHDGVNLNWYTSTDGVNWVFVYANAANVYLTGAQDRIGFGIRLNPTGVSNTPTTAYMTLVDWSQ